LGSRGRLPLRKRKIISQRLRLLTCYDNTDIILSYLTLRKEQAMFKDKYSIKHLIGFSLASIAIMVFAFFSFAPLEKDQLTRIETSVVMAQKNKEMRVSWVTFYDKIGGKYYCHEDLLVNFESTTAFAEALEKDYKGETLSIYYTDRRDLVPFNIPRFWGFNRVAAIECNDEILVSLDTYNSVNTEQLIAWTVVAIIVLLFATGPFVAEKIIYIYSERKNKNQHP